MSKAQAEILSLEAKLMESDEFISEIYDYRGQYAGYWHIGYLVDYGYFLLKPVSDEEKRNIFNHSGES